MSNLSALGSLQGHDHFHGFDFDIWLSGFDASTIVLQITNDFTSHVGAELRRIENCGHQNSISVNNQAKTKGLIHTKDSMRFSTETSNQASFSTLGNLGFNSAVATSQRNDVGRLTLNMEVVAHIVISDFNVERVDGRDSANRSLTFAERFFHFLGLFLNALECLEDSSGSNSQILINFDGNKLFLDDSIEPGGVNCVVNEFLGLQKLHQILHSGTDLSTHFNFLQCQNQSLSSFFTSSSLGKQVSKLTVGKLVNTSVGSNTKVSPNTGGGLELDAFNTSYSRLETFVGVFSSDTGGNDVSLDRIVIFRHEVNSIVSINIASIETTDLRNVVQRNSHGHLQLSGRHVHIGDSFGNRVLYLQTRVQLEEEVLVSGSVVQVFDSTSSLVSNGLSQTLSSTLHFFEGVGLGNDRRPFLKDLLETTLRGTITTVQGDSISMLITHNLDFQVTSVLTKLHDENRTSNNFVLDLDKGIAEIIFVVDKTDTFTTTSFGGFDHETFLIPNAFSGFDGLFNVAAGSFLENVIWDSSLFVQFRLERAIVGPTKTSTPRDGRNLSSLSKNVGSNLISQNTHHRSSWPNEFNTNGLERFRELRLFGSMSPTRPDSIHTVFNGHFGNQVHIGIVLRVLSSRNFHKRVSKTNEFGIGLNVLGTSHGHKLNGAFVSEFHVRPLSHREDGFGGGHTIVGNQDFANDAASSALRNILL